MAAEAEKLINLSLTKIAKSRAQRGGVSLHRNLLVATVLQRARFVFMEEAYHMVQRHDADAGLPTNMCEEHHQHEGYSNSLNFDVCGHVASEVIVDEHGDCVESDSRLFTVLEEANKENNSLFPNESSVLVEIDSRLREDSSILREKLEANPTAQSLTTSRCLEIPVSISYSSSHSPSSLKRRRVIVAEWETEEAILSILPKKAKREAVVSDESEESGILDDVVTVLPDSHSTTEDNEENGVTSMEIDRITSLVSIFSFGGLSGGGNSEVFSVSTENVGKLTRSVSTPDLCSAQAKEGGCVDVMQRPFLAMTV